MDMDPHEVAAAVGRSAGKEDITEAVTSGRLSARECTPLLGGMVDGVIRQILDPLVGVTDWSGFDPTTQPITGVVTLLDGSKLRITIGADQ